MIDRGQFHNADFCQESGKIMYETRGDGLRVRRAIKNRYKGNDVYQCWFCEKWHLGRPSGSLNLMKKVSDFIGNNPGADAEDAAKALKLPLRTALYAVQKLMQRGELGFADDV